MKANSPRRAAAAAMIALGLAGLLAAAPARAELKHLDDQQLQQVHGRAPISAPQLYGNFVAPIAALAGLTAASPAAGGTTPAQLQNLQFDASDWLRFFGLHYDGPSMGTFTLHDVDTSGLQITLQPQHP